MITCRQCGSPNLNEEAACWNCRLPRALVSREPLPPAVIHRLGISRALARRPGWWQLPDAELEALGRAHLGLKAAFNDSWPTQELLDSCYQALRDHGIEPMPVR